MKHLSKNKFLRLVSASMLCVSLWVSAAATQLPFIALTPREQMLLKSSKAIWPKLDQETQQQLRRHTAHWLGLTPDQQAQLFAQQKKWDAQPANVRLSQRVRWHAWQRLGDSEQMKIKAAMARYQAMPLAEQQQLHQQFAQFSQSYQQQWWLGVELGRDAVLLDNWLRFVPDDQLNNWHQLLRELTPEQRYALKKYGDYATAIQRDTLRTRLLSAPKNARADLLANLAK
jgi:Protein of unknown function (DUF3106)